MNCMDDGAEAVLEGPMEDGGRCKCPYAEGRQIVVFRKGGTGHRQRSRLVAGVSTNDLLDCHACLRVPLRPDSPLQRKA